MNPQDSEVIPNIKFEDGKLHPDSAAAAAIKALPAGDMTERLVALEERYQAVPGLWSWTSDKKLRIIRTQVALLAQTIQPLLIAQRIKPVEESFGAEYQRMCAELRDMRRFLVEYFPREIHSAEALKTPLLEVCKQIMMRSHPVVVEKLEG